MTTEQLLTKRNEELAKQDALIQDLLMTIERQKIELSERYITIQELQSELLTLRLRQ